MENAVVKLLLQQGVFAVLFGYLLLYVGLSASKRGNYTLTTE